MEIIRPGRTLYFYKPPRIKPHLWFILTEPEGDVNKFVAVMVRTRRGYTDNTTILDIGDHPFIQHESAVDYGSADFFTLKLIQKKMEHGRCSLKEDLSESLLQRVKDGLLQSARTPNVIHNYCKDRF